VQFEIGIGTADQRWVTIRGKPANLDELEDVLARRTRAAEAAVTAHGDGDRRRLVAYLAGVDRTQVPALHSELVAELPRHLMPSEFVLLDELPRAPGGGVDRLALPAPPRAAAGRSGDRGSWLVRPRPAPRARARLICFPFAGGGPTAFSGWAESLPDHIELCCVQAPGRGERLAETPLTRVDQLVDALGPELARTTRPTAFFGHSLGAVVAFETARWLRRRGHPLPSRLFVSGSAAPQAPVTTTAHQLPDEEFCAHVAAIGGTPRELLDDPRFRRVVLPALRADFAMHETYTCAADTPLECPITAFGGAEDPEATPQKIRSWQSQTTNDFGCQVVPGGHFYLRTARDELLRRIVAELAAVPGAAEAAS
jgi:medium-chain acyl-[acyl-carrier-protein] hydrolase